MAAIEISGFRGRRPVMDDAVLGDNEATVATDCRIQGGKIKPLHLPSTVQAKTTTNAIISMIKYAPTGDFFEWEMDVDAVPAQVANDSFDRYVFTGDGGPKITDSAIAVTGDGPYPTSSYLLGVPPPGYTITTDEDGDAPVVALAGAPTQPGAEWLSGTGVPGTGLGDPGYYYVAEDTSNWYFKEEDDTTWTLKGNFGAPTPGGANYIQYVFQRAAVAADTPTGNGPVPTDWFDTPPSADGTTLFASYAELVTATDALVGSWSDVMQLEGAPTADLPETRFYVVTSLDKYGAEGPPSPVSVAVEWRPGQTVNVTIPSIPTGNYSFTGYNIYRTSTGTSGTDFLFVESGTTWGSTHNDDKLTENLSEILPSEDFDLPNVNMIGVVALPNGFLAGHYKNILFFSEPGHPHAWPVKYQVNTKKNIVGIEVLDDNAILVTTEEKPYICSGTDPYSMVLDEINLKQSCVSKRSIVDMGYGVVYASPDGLVMVGGEGPQLITEGVFSREQWQALVPSTISAFFWEGLYIAFYDDGTTEAGFVFNPSAPNGGIVDLTAHLTAGYNDLAADALYVYPGTGANIQEWDAAATYYAFTWTGKKMDTLSPMNIGVGRLYGDTSQDFTVKLYGDGALKDTLTEADGAPFRFSGGNKYRNHQISITSGATSGSLHGIRLGEIMQDMTSNGDS
jgi:hypothetical protein